MELIPPRDPVANILYRRKVREWALKSKKNRDWLLKRCAEDWFFFIETFCFLYEPRPEANRPMVIPFIPWDHQRPAAQMLLDGLGYDDFGIDKARGEGATWMCLMIIFHRWMFRQMHAYGLVSRHQEAADNPEDPDSLGWKIDWQLKQLPKWMAGERNVDWSRNIGKHTWLNFRNGSSITAYPATGDLASGGRKTAFFLDEFGKFDRREDEKALSAVEPVTNSLLVVSTYEGADGAFYRIMHEDPPPMKKIILDWKDNPSRNRNMFRLDAKNRRLLPVNGKVGEYIKGWDYIEKFFKEYFPLLQRRGFDVDSTSKIWSPWYVSRCIRMGMTPRKIAQEYDRDPGGSGARFFSASLIENLGKRTRPAEVTGEIDYDAEQLTVHRFTEMANGHLRLWIKLLGRNIKPPAAHYVIGADIASGQGGSMSSNSTLSILNRDTGVKVGEYANPTIKPEKLAELAIAMCRWFSSPDGQSAYLIWEGNGLGQAFRGRVMESDFRNFHWRVALKKAGGKKTKEPGWWSAKDSKVELLSKYRWSLIEGFFDNPSSVALKETLCYVNGVGGKLEFVSMVSEEDDLANQGENHADRVIADALANYGMEELNGGLALSIPKNTQMKNHLSPPQGSFAARQKRNQEKTKKRSYW